MSGPTTTGSSIFKIVNGLRYFGVGSRVTRSIYKFPNTYWILTKVDLSKDQEHGKAWGRLVWRGRVKPEDQKLPSNLKSEWSLISLPEYNVYPSGSGSGAAHGGFKGTQACIQREIERAQEEQKALEAKGLVPPMKMSVKDMAKAAAAKSA